MNLNEMYRKLNAEFFDGKLPEYRVTLYTFSSSNQDGEIRRKRRLIRIARHLAQDPEELRSTLLHEMSHIKCPYHGKVFLRQLKRLGQCGEVWAIHELRDYPDASSWNDEMSNLAGFVECVVDVNRDIPFREIIKYMANHYAMSPSELLKGAPWLPRTYENAKRDVENLNKIKKIDKTNDNDR